MSSPGDGEAITFAFAEAASRAWGAGWSAADGTALVMGAGDQVWPLAAEVEIDRQRDEWRVLAPAARLVLSPAAAPAEASDPAAGSGELCRVSGEVAVGGKRADVSAVGWRRSDRAVSSSGWSSLRQVAAWFSGEEGVALTARRPKGAQAHGDDLVQAEILGPERLAIEGPRLSTTYGADGEPLRAGIELWVGRPDSEELYPIRASGEAVGPRARVDEDGQSTTVRLFRWHSRGREGIGVYLLRRR